MTGDELERRISACRAALRILLRSGFSERMDASTSAEFGNRRLLAEATRPRAG